MNDETQEAHDTVLTLRVPRGLIDRLDSLVPVFESRALKGQRLTRADIVRHLLELGIARERQTTAER